MWKKVEKERKSKSTFWGVEKFLWRVRVLQLCVRFTEKNKSEPLTTICLGNFRLKQTQKGVSESQCRERPNVSVCTWEIWEEKGLLSTDTQSTPL